MKNSPNFDTRIKNCLQLAGERIAELKQAGRCKEALELEQSVKQLRGKNNGN